jgi:microcystin-dependent protein
MARNYSSISEPKTLTSNVSSVATQITLNNVTGLPSVPYVLVLNPDTANEEVVLVNTDQTGVTSPTLKVSRAIETGSSAKTHTSGDTVKHMIVATDLQIVHDHFSNDNVSTGTAHGATGGIVGRTNSQTLTNKTVNLTSNTLTGTLAQFNTALSDADFATTTTAQTLTSKTLTSPTIDGATMTGTTTFPTTGSGLMPVGSVGMWVTGTAPTGWLLCQGQQVAIADYSTLSSVLGTTYGILTNGSGLAGTTHFRLPDLRGRIPMGAGTGRNVADTADLTARTLGAKISDAETVLLTAAESGVPAHSHSITDKAHSHNQSGREVALTGGGAPALIDPSFGAGSTNTGSSYTGITGTNNNTTAPASSAHNNVQPSTVINFIIKY